jgi:RNA polymerase sigma-70 factor (ECF subfamily)
MRQASRIFDGLLVLRFRAGETNAMGILVKRHNRKLIRHAYWYTGDMESAKDIVQDSWQNIILKFGQLDDPDKFESWAMTIVRRKALDFRSGLKAKRIEQKEIRAETATGDINEEAVKTGQIKLLRDAINSLPAEQQEVLRLFYTESQSLIEIGRILEIPVGTVKSRLYHAREKLKSLLNLKK